MTTPTQTPNPATPPGEGDQPPAGTPAPPPAEKPDPTPAAGEGDKPPAATTAKPQGDPPAAEPKPQGDAPDHVALERDVFRALALGGHKLANPKSAEFIVAQATALAEAGVSPDAAIADVLRDHAYLLAPEPTVVPAAPPAPGTPPAPPAPALPKRTSQPIELGEPEVPNALTMTRSEFAEHKRRMGYA